MKPSARKARASSSSSKSSRTAQSLVVSCLLGSCALAQSATHPPPGQPQKSGTPGTFEVVGDSVVSAQQMFVGTANTVYIIDKVEANPTQIKGHPAWAAEYNVNTDGTRAMDIVTNSFCAGGSVLGNGTWLNVGGNQAVTYGGATAESQLGGPPYDDLDGGRSLRLLNPCDDQSCEWFDSGTLQLTTRRWYPTLETLEDGSVIIIGGNQMGGFVNDAGNNNPTYEYFPTRGAPIGFPLLERTLPANLYPFTFLLPSGNLMLQLNWATSILDYKNNREFPLDDIPEAVRTYPASAGVAMLPLTPANNWTATILFCGGSNIASDQWNTGWNIAAFPASSSCVKITPDLTGSYEHDDPLQEGRVMANFVLLPDGKVFCVNGANSGVSGYGNDSWAIGQSYGDNPILTPAIFDASQPAGKRWSQDGLSASTVPRMYHSTAVLLADGSVFISGSNPNADYTVGPDVRYPTEYRTERFYPSYYNQRRPQPVGLPTSIGYGGAYFNVTLDGDDLFGDANNVKSASVVLIRQGFSTHAYNMGQRMVQLESSYAADGKEKTATLFVSQLPPNPAILAPGPAYLFVVVNGVPSVGVQVMVGNGQIGAQPTTDATPLPQANIASPQDGSDGSGQGNGAVAAVVGAEGAVWRMAAVAGVIVAGLMA